MAVIEYLDSSILYQNPRPHVRSRQAYFPGLVLLPSGELLAAFMIGEAFEAANATTYISRSSDRGVTWTLQGPLHDKSALPVPASPVPTSDVLKPAALSDGSLIATGYRFERRDPEQSISIPATGGILPGDDIVSFSADEGRTWTEPRVIPRSRPELLELSGPCVELRSGDLIGVAACYKMPDGSSPSGQIGVMIRSTDRGRTWDDRTVFFRSAAGNLTPFEPRVCEMQPGRLAALVWAYDQENDEHHPNHMVVSRDDGHTWSSPIDTGVMGQASNLIWLGGDLLATIHSHREGEIGIVVRIVDFKDDRWRVLAEQTIYGQGGGAQTRAGQTSSEMFASLRFGQPSLLRLSDTRLSNIELLAAHWAVEDGQGLIRLHRLRVEV